MFNLAEFSCIRLPAEVEGSLAVEARDFPLLEATSSGMTHAWGEQGEFGFVPEFVRAFTGAWFRGIHNRLSIPSERHSPEHRLQLFGDAIFPLLNFGLIEIDWENKVVLLSIRDRFGKLAMRHAVAIGPDDAAGAPSGIELLQAGDCRTESRFDVKFGRELAVARAACLLVFLVYVLLQCASFLDALLDRIAGLRLRRYGWAGLFMLSGVLLSACMLCEKN